jgi:uncharacterized protein YlaN (UPF0358 family)
MAFGLSWQEARALPLEQVLCLLAHDALNRSVAALEHEADRVASLTLVDETKQQQRLATLELRIRGLLDRFYRRDSEE